MASLIHLDTHAVIWLAADELSRFPVFVPPLLQQAPPVFSPVVLLENDYLHEAAKLKMLGRDIENGLAEKIGLTLNTGGLTAIVQAPATLTSARNLFHWLISAGTHVTRGATVLPVESSAFWNRPPP